MTRARVHRKSSIRTPPIAAWPLWKVVGLGLIGYGPISAMLFVSSLVPPPFHPELFAVISILILALGLFFTVWTSRRPSWAPRFGGTALVALLFLGLGIRFWAMIVNGFWFWVVVLLFVALFVLAWLLPAASESLSALLWREQMAPQTKIARRVMSWLLAIGLGGAGVLGASTGASLVRTGGARLAYLILALGMSILGVLIAQGFAHQLWPDTPWGRRFERLESSIKE